MPLMGKAYFKLSTTVPGHDRILTYLLRSGGIVNESPTHTTTEGELSCIVPVGRALPAVGTPAHIAAQNGDDAVAAAR
jgi:hypothetical protein